VTAVRRPQPTQLPAGWKPTITPDADPLVDTVAVPVTT
jgi:hypothetical protein